MRANLFSAPDEYYEEHIRNCEEKFEIIFPLFYYSILRLFPKNLDFDTLKTTSKNIIKFHDLGKLTEKWQENLKNKKGLPPHAPVGAAYLWKSISFPDDDLKFASSFAIAIHHTDKGLLGDNIEKPDVQAILSGIVKNNGSLKWHPEVKNLNKKLYPEEAERLNISDLKNMARDLRIWSRGCDLYIQQKRRLQVAFIHHILKICDISASKEREEFKKEEEENFGGWIMLKEIEEYVKRLEKRCQK